jgi:hypothetical protein
VGGRIIFVLVFDLGASVGVVADEGSGGFLGALLRFWSRSLDSVEM